MKRLHLSGALERVNKELWVVLSLFAIALLLNQVIAAQRMVLSFFVLPTIASAYFYGRRHGTLTALASVLLVVGLLLFHNSIDGATAAATMTYHGMAGGCGVGRFARRHGISDGNLVPAQKPADQRTPRNLSRASC